MKNRIAFISMVIFIGFVILPMVFAATEPKYLNLYADKTVFIPDEPIGFTIRTQNLSAVDLKVYKVSLTNYLAVSHNLSELLRLDLRTKPVVSRWAERMKPEPYSKGWYYAYPSFTLAQPGAYVIEGEAGGRQDRIIITITTLALVTKQARDKLLVFAARLDGNRSFAKALISVYRAEETVSQGYTNSEGLCELKLSGELRNLKVVGKYNENYALVYSNYSPFESPYKAYIYTDRPIYRPGQKVYFKGVLRKDEGGEYVVLKGKDIVVDILDPNDAQVYKKEIKTNGYGSFYGEFQLGVEPALGEYTIQAHINRAVCHGGFIVAAYRKPEYKVTVEADKKRYLGGEVIKVKVKAAYYFGGAVAGANVGYNIYKSYYYYYPWLAEEIYAEEEEEEEEEYYGYYGEFVAHGEAKTNGRGEVEFIVQTKKEDSDKRYFIEVTVTDRSRREVMGKADVLVTRGAFCIYIRTESYVYKTGEPVLVKIKAQDYDRKPVDRKEIFVGVTLQRWEKGRWQKKHVFSKSVTTDGDGVAQFEFRPQRTGDYQIEAKTQDRFKNLITDTDYVWVTDETFGDVNYNFGSLEIKTDKKVYQPGEVAKIMVNTKNPNLTMLFTIEGYKIYQYKIIQLKGYSKLIELKLPQEYSPNVYISACYVYRGLFYNNGVPIFVKPQNKFLQVTIKANKKYYKPRQKARFLVTTRDDKGKPVAAELSLGLVDASIYAIQEERIPDIRKFFYGRRANLVATNYSFVRTYTGGVKEAAKEGVRRIFRDTAYWNPVIYTDRNGRAVVSFELPDNLTTWRATAVAHTLRTQVVKVKDENTMTTKKLIARLITPRFFTQADKTLISAVIHNGFDRLKKVKVRLEVASGIKILNPQTRKITIPAKGMKGLDWEVKVEEAGDAQIMVSAEVTAGVLVRAGRAIKGAFGRLAAFIVRRPYISVASDVYDAMELTVPVLPHGVEKVVASADEVKDTKTYEITIPADTIKEATQLKLTLSPTIAATALGALEYLAKYPYGCTEQTMSCFLPDVILAQTLKDLKLKEEELERKLPGMVSAGLQKLYNYQHYDGGWGWCEYDETDSYMTAYVTYGLILAEKAGFLVDKNKIKAGIECLKGRIGREEELDTKTYMLFTLSLSGEKYLNIAGDLYKVADKLKSYSQAILAIAFHNFGDREHAKALIRKLEKSAKVTATTCFWENQGDWDFNQCEATAYALKAILQMEPTNPNVTKIVRWLVLARQGNGWMSTKDTAAIIYALADYIRITAELSPPDYVAQVYLNGQLVKKQGITKANVLEHFEVIIPSADLRDGFNQIKIVKEGEGKLYYTSFLKYFVKEEDIKAVNKGFKVKRALFRRIAKRDKYGDWVHKLVPLKGSISSGDEIEVQLTVKGLGVGKHVIIEDPLPSGCEVITERHEEYYWEYWYAEKEVRDDKVCFFADYLNGGENKFSYVFRAEVPGNYHILPTRAYGMYMPEIWGIADESRLIVK